MTRIVIAGDANLPADVKHGDTLKITATVFVAATRRDLVESAELGNTALLAGPGELSVETLIIECVGEQAFSVGVSPAG